MSNKISHFKASEKLLSQKYKQKCRGYLKPGNEKCGVRRANTWKTGAIGQWQVTTPTRSVPNTKHKWALVYSRGQHMLRAHEKDSRS